MLTKHLDDRSWRLLSDSVRGLEAAWSESPRPELAAFVPSDDDPLRTRILVELIKVDQEYRWSSGERCPLETYLVAWPQLASDAAALAELVEAECFLQAERGERLDPLELATRFPDIGERLDLARIAAAAERESQLTAHAGDQADVQTTQDTSAVANLETPTQFYDTKAEALAERSSRSTMTIGMLSEPFQVTPIGKRLGRFEIRALIAAGGMGTVYRAYDPNLNREVALKVPQAEFLADPVTLERFLREGKAAAAVRDPHICPIYEAGQLDGVHYLAMALIPGEPLSTWISRHSVTQSEAAEIVRKLALALDRLHVAGVLHRDIKASNVVIDDSGEPVLMDFGLARQERDDQHLTITGSFLGTPAYLPPEQVSQGATVADARGDIYSLGVVLYQLLTGRLPFMGPLTKVLVAIENEVPPSPRALRPDLDADLEAICLKSIAKSPTDRFQTASEFAEALQEFLRSATPLVGVVPARCSYGETRPLGSPANATKPLSTDEPLAAERGILRGKPGGGSGKRGLRTALVAAAAFFALVAGIVIYVNTGEGQLELTVNEPDITVKIDGQPRTITLSSPRDTIVLTVPSGQHELLVSKDGFETHTRSFSVRRNGKIELMAALVPHEKKSTAKQPAERPAPSVWDQLDPRHIPERERVPRQPDGLVAVLGEHRQRLGYRIEQASVSSDGSQFALTSDAGLFVWNRTEPSRPRFFDMGYHPTGTVFLPDGRIAVGGHQESALPNQLRLYALPNDEGRISEAVKFTPMEWGRGVPAVAASRDGRWLASQHGNQEIVLWDITGTEPKAVVKFRGEEKTDGLTLPPSSFSPDSRWFCFVDRKDRTVRLIDLRSTPPRETAVLRAPDDAPADEPAKGFQNAAFVSDGRLATSNTKRFWLWDITGSEPKRVGNRAFGNFIASYWVGLILTSRHIFGWFG